MSDGQGGVPIKKKLLGWMQGAIGKLEQALDEKANAPEPAAPAAPAAPSNRTATGGLPGQRASTGSLPGQRPATGSLGAAAPGARAASTGQLGRNTDSLMRSGPSAPLPGGGPAPFAPPPAKDPEVAAAESRKRMSFIISYMKDPEGDPVFQDKQLVYKVLTEERSYQQNLIVRLTDELKAVEAGSEAASELEEQLATARNRQGQLFTLLKRLTGIRGKTGGTGFIAKAAEPPPLPPIGQAAPPSEEAPSDPDAPPSEA